MIVMLVVLHVLCVALALVAYDVPLRCASRAKVNLDRSRLHKVADAFGATLAWMLAVHWMELAEVSSAHLFLSEKRLHEMKFYWGGYHGIPMVLRWILCGAAFSTAAMLLFTERQCSGNGGNGSEQATWAREVNPVVQPDDQSECEDTREPEQGSSRTEPLPTSPNNPFHIRRRIHEPLPLEDSQEVDGHGDENQDQSQIEHQHNVKQTSLPSATRSSSFDSRLSKDDVDRVHLIWFILRQLLHKTLSNVGAIALLRAVETTLTPSSWVRLVEKDLVAVETGLSGGEHYNIYAGVESDDGSWDAGLVDEIADTQSSGSWDDMRPLPPPPPAVQPEPSPEPEMVLMPECKWLDNSEVGHAAVVRDLECGALPVSWLAVPNSSVTIDDPCCQEKLLWGDGLLLALYAMLAMWSGQTQNISLLLDLCAILNVKGNCLWQGGIAGAWCHRGLAALCTAHSS